MHAANNPCQDGVVSPAIELRHLRYFAAVVQEGTFTAAADRLGMTQLAMSRAVRALERECGRRVRCRAGGGSARRS
ncbi:helix-turn-helix domain-containing protein [Amycolatopsis vastitatis]|uniref:helix-turn-helix domain-containing protein n=1 Tax=Amycolatopsis vastitatis TaxID=1905142 RepID=UPI001F0A7B8C|nr:LysR family transcriptional regulator [Amycolatopsis vastitatis]